MGLEWVIAWFFGHFDPFLAIWSFWPTRRWVQSYFFYRKLKLTKCDLKNIVTPFEPTSFVGLEWVISFFLDHFDPFLAFWPTRRWVQSNFFYRKLKLTKCDPKNIVTPFEPTSFVGLEWVISCFFYHFDPFLAFWPTRKLVQSNYQIARNGSKWSKKDDMTNSKPTKEVGSKGVTMFFWSHFVSFDFL